MDWLGHEPSGEKREARRGERVLLASRLWHSDKFTSTTHHNVPYRPERTLGLLTVIDTPGAAAALAARLNRLTSESRAQWGRMSAHGMLCHVADVAIGIRSLPGAPARPRKAFRAFVGLHTPLPWPKGIRTPAQVDQEKGGTPPGEFEADRARAIAAIEAQAIAGPWPEYHPIFGKLSEWEWKRFAWRHTDHHLKQFGL